jgi:hypothetical protein
MHEHDMHTDDMHTDDMHTNEMRADITGQLRDAQRCGPDRLRSRSARNTLL